VVLRIFTTPSFLLSEYQHRGAPKAFFSFAARCHPANSRFFAQSGSTCFEIEVEKARRLEARRGFAR
jgi:hypothetical protein